MASRRTRRRASNNRWPVQSGGAVALVAALALTACGQAASTPVTGERTDTTGGPVVEEPTATPTPTPPPELPGGGREIFPQYRLVGYSGVKGDVNEDLGRLTGNLNARCRQIKKIGKDYARGREVLPVFEMITTVVLGSPGKDGMYRFRRPRAEVQEYLDAARKCGALLLLNIQPGRSEFMPEMQHYERFLREPDVGVALDPEWAMDPGEVPGVNLGRTTGPELNRAAEYLAGLVQEGNLPEKAMVFHQFNLDAVEKVGKIRPHDGVAIIRSIDGLGGPSMKIEEYNTLAKKLPHYIHPGFKLFYKEDVNPPWGSRLMTPDEVMKLKPRPEYILYE